MGTPTLARTVLSTLADETPGDIALVVPQPDKPRGRGLACQPPPVKQEAVSRGLPIDQPSSARDPAFLDRLRAIAPDVIVVAAYGQLLPPDLLAIPRHGCLNLHTSLLPRWRGAAPIQWAILAGDRLTGVTLMRMDAGLDTGDILATSSIPIQDTDTSQTLHDRLADLGASLLVRSLPDWLAGRLPPVPQPAEGITIARKLTKEDGRLNWSESCLALGRRIRALDPWPGAFTTFPDPAGRPLLLKIWRATPVPEQGPSGVVLRASGSELIVATGEGALRLDVLQREGRRPLPARDFLAGQTVREGQRLGGS
ncbi:MAG: methionyl-tRNA formyltransferase [Verrucomicrobiae bacterium]|nr:methionyl-tRNA formyltransferase [Verrucomicrobiae bacterium]